MPTSPTRPLPWSLIGSEDSLAIDIERSSNGRGRRTLPGFATQLERITHNFERAVCRRWKRERRRRKVGRAYDMALEISRHVPRGANVLDVGCGNGFITHHLAAMLGSNVTGIDLAETTEALIEYRQFDGRRFPIADQSTDAILFCYVLHHAQDLGAILNEVRRTLRNNGLLIVYEDIPRRGWDQIICGLHDMKWRGRTGPCTFRGEREWYDTFASEGFELQKTRPLSRWRNLAHPVSRRFYVLRKKAFPSYSPSLQAFANAPKPPALLHYEG